MWNKNYHENLSNRKKTNILNRFFALQYVRQKQEQKTYCFKFCSQIMFNIFEEMLGE